MINLIRETSVLAFAVAVFVISSAELPVAFGAMFAGAWLGGADIAFATSSPREKSLIIREAIEHLPVVGPYARRTRPVIE